MIEPMIVQHPSTPEEMKNPQELIEKCMAEFFPHVISTMAEFGFEVETKEFHEIDIFLIEIPLSGPSEI